MGNLLPLMCVSLSFANKVRTSGETGDVILYVISQGQMADYWQIRKIQGLQCKDFFIALK